MFELNEIIHAFQVRGNYFATFSARLFDQKTLRMDPTENVFYLLCFIMTADFAPGPFARGLGSLKPDLK